VPANSCVYDRSVSLVPPPTHYIAFQRRGQSWLGCSRTFAATGGPAPVRSCSSLRANQTVQHPVPAAECWEFAGVDLRPRAGGLSSRLRRAHGWGGTGSGSKLHDRLVSFKQTTQPWLKCDDTICITEQQTGFASRTGVDQPGCAGGCAGGELGYSVVSRFCHITGAVGGTPVAADQRLHQRMCSRARGLRERWRQGACC
jgi:hypothetical protein